MKNKIIENIIDYNPGFLDYRKNPFNPVWISYERKWFCESNKTIHSSEKEFMNCKNCCPIMDKIEFEGLQRLKFLTENYVSKKLDSNFSELTTEDICDIYNVKINFFRPWSK